MGGVLPSGGPHWKVRTRGPSTVVVKSSGGPSGAETVETKIQVISVPSKCPLLMSYGSHVYTHSCFLASEFQAPIGTYSGHYSILCDINSWHLAISVCGNSMFM